MRSVDDITAAELLDGLPSRVHEVYAPFVRDIPDHPAFVEGGRSWSYRQFSEAVDAASKDLSNLGIRPGDRVMIASENSVALGAMLFAASKLDAWGIAVNPRLSAREIDLIGTHSGARRVLFNAALPAATSALFCRNLLRLSLFSELSIGFSSPFPILAITGGVRSGNGSILTRPSIAQSQQIR